MKKYITLLIVWFFISYQGVFAAECTLKTTPSPSIDAYAKNVDKILEAAKAAAKDSVCTRPADSPAHLEVAIPAQSVRGLLNALSAVWYDLKSLLSDVRYYFDSSDTMLLTETQSHQNTILEIQEKIYKASTEVASKCAQGVIRFDSDVALDGGATYKTKGKLLQEVLVSTNDQTKHVLIFFRNLVTNVADREYVDETLFPIAPAGFANEMRNFYSSENLQQCHEEEPKNQKIMETLKEAFTTWWKYPQAIQIWKDAFNLLFYRSAQLTWSGETDSSKEAQINSIVQAQKWWVGNSRLMLNSEFFKEFKKRANNQTVMEWVKEVSKRIAYETFGSLFTRQIIPDIRKEKGEQAAVAVLDFPESDKDGTRLATIDKNLYTDYAVRKELVWQNKAQDPKTVVGLVQALEQLELARPIIEEIAQLICDLYGRQATNVSRPTCQELFNV